MRIDWFLPISDSTPVADKSAAKTAAGFSFCFPRTRAFLFLVKKIFVRDENKIHFLFIFFLSILKAISSLKPAGEAETRTHVNKL